MDRAAHFLPALAHAPRPAGADVRVGLRPFAVVGLPIVGPVPGLPAGHEGSGLCLRPTTAQLAVQYLLGQGVIPVERFKESLAEVRVTSAGA